jgi:galactitol-specific phosphotransferase system IIC component
MVFRFYWFIEALNLISKEITAFISASVSEMNFYEGINIFCCD